MSSLADALSTLSDRGLRRLLGARTFLRGLDYEKRKVVDDVSLNETHAQGRVTPVWTGNDHVFGLHREHAGDRLLLLANFSAEPQPVHAALAREHGVRGAQESGFLTLGAYEFAWMRN